MQVAGNVPEIGRDRALDRIAVDLTPLVVDLLHNPDAARDGDLVPHRGRLDDGAELLRIAADGVFLVLLEDRVELEAVDHALTGQSHDEAAVFRALELIGFQQMLQQAAEVVLVDGSEGGEGQDPPGKLRRRHLTLRGQGAHGLVIEEGKGQTALARRFDPAVLQIELDQGDRLQQPPGNGLGQDGPRLGVLLADDEPHLLRVAAPTGAAHALQKAGDRPRRVDLEGPLQLADVDSKLQRCRGAGGQRAVVLLHCKLRALAVGDGEVPVVDQKAIRLMPGLAVAAQGGGDLLAFLAGIGEDQALPALRMLVDVAEAGVCCRRSVVIHRLVGLCFGFQRHTGGGLRLRSLGRRLVEMLHGKPPLHPRRLDPGDQGIPPGPGGEQTAHGLRVADGRGKADPPRIDACRPSKPLDQAEGLHAAIPAQEGVDLVDDHEAQIPEQAGQLAVPADQHGLQGFRRDLQDAGGLLHQLPLVGIGDVPVPVPDGDPGLVQQVVEPQELVVDQSLERGDVEAAYRRGRVFRKQGEDREKGGLRLAGGRGRSQQNVVVGAEDRFARRGLNAAQRLPLIAVNKILYEGGIA